MDTQKIYLMKMTNLEIINNNCLLHIVKTASQIKP